MKTKFQIQDKGGPVTNTVEFFLEQAGDTVNVKAVDTDGDEWLVIGFTPGEMVTTYRGIEGDIGLVLDDDLSVEVTID